MKIYIHTFGCKLNQYESEQIAHKLKSLGFSVSDIGLADAVAINTCTVTAESDKKLLLYLSNLENYKHHTIFLIGCYVSKDEIKNKLPQVNRKNIVCITNEEKYIAAEIISNTLTKASFHLKSFGEEIFFPQNQSRAFLKIQDGCSVFCSYCLVSRVRGSNKSKSTSQIFDAIKSAASHGYKEIVFTGLNLGSYMQEEVNFTDMLKDALNIASDLKIRIRLSSIEPVYFSTDLINLFKKENSEILCPHVHVPLQSGSDKILKLMNRRYDSKTFLSIVENLYKFNENIAITTDVMVGFPNESKEDFEQTYRVSEESRFLKMHIFRYSVREGTPAASMNGKVGSRTKLKRAKILDLLRMRMQNEYYQAVSNMVLSVIVEKKNSDTIYEGTSGEYLKVEFLSDQALEKKMLVSVQIIERQKDKIIGLHAPNL